MRHALGIDSRSRSMCNGCATKMIGGRSRLRSRTPWRVRPCDNIHTTAVRMSRTTPAMAAHSTHRRLTCLRLTRGTPLLQTGDATLGTSAALAALDCNPIGCRSPGADTTRACVGFRAMRDEVRSGVARRDAATVRRIRLRQRFTDRAKHRERHHDAPHGNPHCCARSRIRACAGFRLSVAPLRHHHHKF
jgi:hypothetical protein